MFILVTAGEVNGQGRRSLGLAKMRNWEQTVNLFDNIIVDRGSKYSVSGAPVTTQDEVQQFLKTLKRLKIWATHNTWAVHCRDAGPLKNDDGEAGAGLIIL